MSPPAAGTGVLHPQPRSRFQPDGGAVRAAAALQRGAAVGDVRGADVCVAQQEGAAAQEVHQDRCTVRAEPSGVEHPSVPGNTLCFSNFDVHKVQTMLCLHL